MTPTPRAEMTKLLEECVSSIQKIAAGPEGFSPYALTVRDDQPGAIVSADPTAPPTEAVDLLRRLLRKRAEAGTLRACAILVDVTMTNQDTGQKVDAIRITLEHRDARPLGFVLTYTQTEGGKNFHDLKAIPGASLVFEEAGGEAAEATDQPTPEEIQRFIGTITEYARLHVEKSREIAGEELAYNAQCFALNDRIISQGWGGTPPQQLDVVVLTFGSFIGEAIRHLHGGEWAFDREHGFFLKDVGASKTAVFPFKKVRARFVNGEADSLEEYYGQLASNLEPTG